MVSVLRHRRHVGRVPAGPGDPHFIVEFADGTKQEGPPIATGETGWLLFRDAPIARLYFNLNRERVYILEGCDAYNVAVVSATPAHGGGMARALAAQMFGLRKNGIFLMTIRGDGGVNEAMLPPEKQQDIGGKWREG